ncbi:S1C family serine protease [Metabacillus sediminilitoris]|uniref:Trypsin-like serine protease n=1 Tax=Metabacillus sediminilitoris TaxID=2567941 RepID=A0A4S4BMV6_9BACI|nr:trypsin-like peptidase domain-containing protein [Metabacillus sediminilitoris]QGQ46580.1 trypsin-like serine protease [Metabacillus sediminilitoris]THF75977.1 trypsin-like serine protease [Metabacillus sediminilitoris]
MNRKLIISIIVTILIWVCGGLGYVYTKDKIAEKMFSESTILKRVESSGIKQAVPDIKEIIREAQKKVVMVELDDGSVGSGFLYNKKGDVITNAHVVSGADTVKIRTTDAKGFNGQVIGISTETDVAVVRVEGLKNIDPLPLEPSSKLEIGDEILALGSPLGFQNTVTTGIISGTDRELNVDPYIYENVYQISAPIAPGNSGGPLIDRSTGKVVGINSARIEQGNIGFSIPINSVLSLVNSWSETPMKNLPAITSLNSAADIDVNKMLETSDYLVNYFIESINFRDFVTAYSLLGSESQSNIDYQTFRNQYLNTISLSVNELKTTNQENQVIVETEISAIERTGEKEKTKTYNMNFIVAYENDQAKIISKEIVE